MSWHSPPCLRTHTHRQSPLLYRYSNCDVNLSLHCEKNKNKQHEAGFGPFLTVTSTLNNRISSHLLGLERALGSPGSSPTHRYSSIISSSNSRYRIVNFIKLDFWNCKLQLLIFSRGLEFCINFLFISNSLVTAIICMYWKSTSIAENEPWSMYMRTGLRYLYVACCSRFSFPQFCLTLSHKVH